ncbi:hypothetical protein L6164_024106 [Bauhinia variegata]|uniref:Uncharacterized protein n=1 Tax=Bauhinia variegata TaxID=167791 RepID=A0ACB9LWN6_BAUVA|nr:hypothetical protein L6164_024106 [Bauhinia variegata]
MEQDKQQRWEGKVSAQLRNATADQIWLLLKDFFNFHKWFPSLSTCYGVHGCNGEPGCIRYCAGFSISSHGSEKSVSWSKERLVAIDHVDRSLSYEITDCNIGFKSYKSTIKVVPGVNGGDGQGGCVIHWFFTVDPVEGWALEDLANKYDVGLQSMAIKMEDEIANSVDPEGAERSMAEEKWEGKASVEVGNSGADQVWSLIEDFCNLHKWLPIDTCSQVEGVAGQPGLIRHCTFTARDGDETKVLWAKEKLVEIDPIQRYLSYEILDNNLGMGSYVATMRVLPINGDGSNDGRGCQIQWSFVCDPVQGQTFQEFMSYIESSLQFMGNKMESHFSAPTQQ